MRWRHALYALSVLALAAPAAQAADGIKLYQVSSGNLELDKGWFTAMKDVGKKISVPVAMYVIDHPRGLTVFDTGNNVEVSDGKCESYWGKGLCGAFYPTQKRDEVIDKQLEKLGYKADQVKYVIYSHFHLDHVGNIKMFPNATHVVQKEELKTAWWPEKFQSAAFVLKDYDGTRDYKFMQLTGDFDLFGDGSLMILDTKGHTQGHQSVQIKLPKTGTLLLSADAIYSAENEAGAIPGITWSTTHSMQSIDRLKQIRDATQGQIWYSHGAEQYAEHQHDKPYE